MAVLEVLKHSRAVYKTMKDQQTGWKHKLKEVLIEIGIIVFAITLSLWLHNWSEQNHVKQEEKEFLTGLQVDMQKDLEELKSDLNTYNFVAKGFNYFHNVAYGLPLQQDSLQHYRWILYSFTQFNPNNSRFEGLKASGKLGIIEDKELQINILELYQDDIYWLRGANEEMNTYKKEKIESTTNIFLIQDKHGNGNWEQVFRQPQIQNLLIATPFRISHIKTRYQDVITKYNKVLALIDKQLKE